MQELLLEWLEMSKLRPGESKVVFNAELTVENGNGCISCDRLKFFAEWQWAGYKL